VAALFIFLWIIGGAPAVVLGEVVRADDQRIARAGRIAFALLLWVDLLVAAFMFSVGDAAVTIHMTRSLWWFTVIAAGIPLALVSGLAVSRGYTGHRVVLAIATLITAALYLVFPVAFIPQSQPKLTGLGSWTHDHKLLGVLILLIPTLILLANELRWKHGVEPDPDPDRVSFRSLWAIPRRYLIGAALFLLVFVWLAGTNSSGMLLGLGVVLAGLGIVLWWRDRVIMRGVLRDLSPPDPPAS
jgi:hypothetical protein